MKKQNKETKRETMEGLSTRPDYKIEREVQEDGSVLYYHPAALSHERSEPVKGENLYDVLREPIRRVKALIGLLDDDDYGRFGFVAEAITEEADRLYDEVFHFLDEAIGKIEVDVMGRGSVVYRTGRVLSARITRLEDKENEVAV